MTNYSVELWARCTSIVQPTQEEITPGKKGIGKYIFSSLEEAEKARKDHMDYIHMIEYEESCESGHM